MKERKLYHPLWTHLPAVALLGLIIARFVSAMPLPKLVPLQFDIHGNPGRLGSPWELFAITVGISFLWLVISCVADELWARQENRKTFNWMSLIDEVIIGMMAGIFLYYGDFRHQLQSGPSWAAMLSWAARGVIAAAALEYFRPYIPHKNHYQPEDTSRLSAEIGAFLEEGKPWVYWESQNPSWMNLALAAGFISMLFGAGQAYGESPAAAVPLALLALIFVPLYGGLRVSVTPERLQVRLGIFGIPLLRLWLSDLASVEVHEFSPLKDFGGYGIRFNRQMKAYYFRGNRGALVTTTQGKKYLIGSDHPERLAAVVDVARRMAG
ncbi:MAG: hypothetical protein NT018_00505 [Armatimonadetes bacterium]|nr:hypothetical protein [Armatimonadota bacterium]